jgi:hypothetical protein
MVVFGIDGFLGTVRDASITELQCRGVGTVEPQITQMRQIRNREQLPRRIERRAEQMDDYVRVTF